MSALATPTRSRSFRTKHLLDEQEWGAHIRGLKIVCDFENVCFIGGGPVRSRSEWRRRLGEPAFDQWVYFIQAGHQGPIKIGIARDPQERLRQLQGTHYEDLHLCAIGPGDRETESLLHCHYARTKIRGEWFSVTPDLTDHTQRLFAAYGRKQSEMEMWGFAF